MPLTPGTRLGAYEILGPLGAGGMGEVYRARDPRLGREVAVKVLPTALAGDGGRLARFEQEARAAAALNHPNILAVYDIGRFDGSPYIVSELLEGQTLRDRLGPGAGPGRAALPTRKSIDYAIQLAHGLAAAHDKGIVHRDLKPENVFVTVDGRVKILDFGLAKLTHPDGAEVAEANTQSNTDPGMVLGTVGYMSPEQVRGQSADHRSDVFAFGVVLYEMLSGRRAFQRESSVETMTAILKDDPPDLPMAERHLPPALTRIVDRCLEKDAGARFQSTHDLAFALEALSSSTEATRVVAAGTSVATRATRDRLAWALVVVLAVGLAGALALGAIQHFRPGPAAPGTTRFFVSPPDGWRLALQVQGGPAVGPIAVSPDGRQVAFVARPAEGGPLIWVRSLDTLEARGLSGTEGGSSPFWSPDSRSIAFFADGKLKRIEVAGGPPVTLCDASPGIAGSWSPDGVIVFSAAGATALLRVSASGGTPAPATELAEGETGHSRPFFLPDGRHFLYRAILAGATRAPTYVGSLDVDEPPTRLVDVDSTNVVYSAGHLLFLRESTLMAQPFDAGTLAVTGDAFPVAEHIQRFGVVPYGFFSASANGVLAYQTGTEAGTPRLTWFTREGEAEETVGEPAPYGYLSVAPDGTKASVSLANDVWLLDLQRNGLATRFTFDNSTDTGGIWSPDATSITFISDRGGTFDLYQKASNNAGDEVPLFADALSKLPTSWSPDGRFLLYQTGGGTSDIFVLPARGEPPSAAEPRMPFPQTDLSAEAAGVFSPDGRWIAYQSNESGQDEVYVVPFDESGSGSRGKWQISTSGGTNPRWRPDMGEIFYVTPQPDNVLMAASVTAGETFSVGAVERLFGIRPPGTPGAFYDVSPDGQRFLVNMAPELDPTPTPVTVVMNWAAGSSD